ncbi:DUF1801 domain-containing protein [Phaeocystidibacter luteus]|uniref:DUF1801 domain-containing protein n=1 Tax=Phaeocystidibacter luteus TaxID=911197 RepID=A0A6N6RE19_9FLAO|nr:DUF1801 domain-containing protein [Phaeocystidibacter luteus]KAB2807727.1 DUF1801 domain-containing protein [Phaeocystidibacter luteus]
MAGLVTIETDRSVDNFIAQVGNASKEADSQVILKMMEEATGIAPKVWGNDKVPDFIIGFGKYSYTRKGSKEEFEWFKLGFAARKTKLTLYLPVDLTQEPLIDDLGKCKIGKGCLYINKLADVDQNVLKQLIEKSATKMK